MKDLLPPILQSSIFDNYSAFDFEGGEILNINKPESWTSFDVVKKIRKEIKDGQMAQMELLNDIKCMVVVTQKDIEQIKENDR